MNPLTRGLKAGQATELPPPPPIIWKGQTRSRCFRSQAFCWQTVNEKNGCVSSDAAESPLFVDGLPSFTSESDKEVCHLGVSVRVGMLSLPAQYAGVAESNISAITNRAMAISRFLVVKRARGMRPSLSLFSDCHADCFVCNPRNRLLVLNNVKNIRLTTSCQPPLGVLILVG